MTSQLIDFRMVVENPLVCAFTSMVPTGRREEAPASCSLLLWARGCVETWERHWSSGQSARAFLPPSSHQAKRKGSDELNNSPKSLQLGAGRFKFFHYDTVFNLLIKKQTERNRVSFALPTWGITGLLLSI